MTEKLPLDTPDRQWLAQLDQEVWKSHTDPRSRIKWSEATRELTEEEISRIWGLVERHGLPCSIRSMNFGFGVGVVIYDHAPVPEIEPEPILAISGDHRPGGKTRERPRFKDDFAYFSRYSHSDKNREILDFYGLEAPQSAAHYDY